MAVVYISHHLEESLEIADDVAVLRDGRLVATATAADVDLAWIVSNMVGRDQDSLFPDRVPSLGEVVLSVRGLQVADPANPERLAVDDLDLDVHAGEIVGVYGLMGSGRTEFLEALAGRLPATAGIITFDGERRWRACPSATASGAGSPWSPRTASATAWSRRCRSGRTSRLSLMAFVRRGLVPATRAERRRRR